MSGISIADNHACRTIQEFSERSAKGVIVMNPEAYLGLTVTIGVVRIYNANSNK